MKFEDFDLEDKDPETEVELLTSMEEEEPEEEEVEEVVEEEEEKAPEPSPAEKELEALRQERLELQRQLKDLSVSTLADRRRLENLEKTITTASEQAEEEEQVTAADVVNYLDQQIAKVDKALAKAEESSPEKAPALRQQLRALERYYNTYVAQAAIEQARGPDPTEVVSKAVQEAELSTNFKGLKSAITQEYPILDAKSQYFNEQLRDEVHRIYNPMIQSGENPVEALARATSLVMRANGILSLSELANKQAPAKEAKAAKTVERKVAAVDKAVKAMEKTPPAMGKVGVSSSEAGSGVIPDFSSIGIHDFMNMSDAQLEQMEKALMTHDL